MSIIIAYTITHTGGSFMCRLVQSNFTAEKFFWKGERFFQNRGRKLRLEDNSCTAIDQPWIQRVALEHLKPQEKNNKDLVLIHGHHKNEGSPLVTTLQQAKPKLPVIVSMRDPMLALNTLIWRHYATQNIHPKDEAIGFRIARTSAVIGRFKGILKAPAEHRYLFPIDTDLSQTLEGRINMVSDLFKFCGLKLTKSGLNAIYDWKPIGLTKEGTLLCKRDHGVNDFNESKDMILSGNIAGLKRILRIEYEVLHQDDELKQLLEQVGYHNLSWW